MAGEMKVSGNEEAASTGIGGRKNEGLFNRDIPKDDDRPSSNGSTSVAR